MSSHSLSFWVPGVVIIGCVFLELTIPFVDTKPAVTASNDSSKVFKDPWILLAAWHCAACQVYDSDNFD